jgi:hypothetical protein
MLSRPATTGYEEVIQGLLARSPAYRTPSVTLDPFDESSATGAETGEDHRGTFRVARGIVFSVVLGVALWGLVIVGILIETIR